MSISRSKYVVFFIGFFLSALYSITDWFWVALLAFAIGVYLLVLMLRNPFLHITLTLCFGIVSAVTLVEFAFFFYHEGWGTHIESVNADGHVGKHHRTDPDVGYGLNAGIYTFKKYRKHNFLFERPIYEMTTTITEDGLRIADDTEHEQACTAAFFGGSFVFGAGVDDHDTLPYVFGRHAEKAFSISNFGIWAYGPNHMLRFLESGMVNEITGPKIDLAVYVGITHHVVRAVGTFGWEANGPAYVLEDGSLRHEGLLLDESSPRVNELKKTIHSLRFLKSYLARNASITEDDIDFYIEIVKASRQITEQQFGARFVVLFWDVLEESRSEQKILTRLYSEGFEVVRASEIIEDIHTNPDPYFIVGDNHPTAFAQRLVGAHMAKQYGDIACRE